MSQATVQTIMKKIEVAVQCQTPLTEIVKVFVKSKQTHLPVVSKSKRFIGMVSQLDCHQALLVSGYHCDKPVLVNDIMVESTISLNKQEHLTQVSMNTREQQSNIFPVLEDEKLIAVVHRVDLLTLLNKELLSCKPF